MGNTSSAEKSQLFIKGAPGVDRQVVSDFFQYVARGFIWRQGGEVNLKFLEEYLKQDKSVKRRVLFSSNSREERFIDMDYFDNHYIPTLLQAVVSKGNAEAVKMVLKHKPKINKCYHLDGKSALHLALSPRPDQSPEAINQAAEIVELLLAQDGIDINLTTGKGNNLTPLETLFLSESPMATPELLLKLCPLLLAKGAMVNFSDRRPNTLTALMIRIGKEQNMTQQKERQFIAVANLLIDKGCDLDIALDIARELQGGRITPALEGLVSKIRHGDVTKSQQYTQEVQKISAVEELEVTSALAEWEVEGHNSWLKEEAERLFKTPSHFICPLTKKLIKSPFVTSVGVSYEKEAIEARADKIDPLTKRPTDGKNVANFALKSLIANFCENSVKQCLELAQAVKSINARVAGLLLERARELNEIIKDSALTAKIDSFSAASEGAAAANPEGAAAEKNTTRLSWFESRMEEALKQKDEIYRDAVSLELMENPMVNSAGQTYSLDTTTAYGGTDPKTRVPVTGVVIPNSNFVLAMEEFKKSFAHIVNGSLKEVCDNPSLSHPDRARCGHNLREILKTIGGSNSQLLPKKEIDESLLKLKSIPTAASGSSVEPLGVKKVVTGALDIGSTV